jgi:hypothetical protein
VKFILNFSSSMQTFSAEWKQCVWSSLRRVNRASAGHYRPTDVLTAFLKAFHFVIQVHIAHYFQNKLNFSHHGFTRTRLAVNEFGRF